MQYSSGGRSWQPTLTTASKFSSHRTRKSCLLSNARPKYGRRQVGKRNQLLLQATSKKELSLSTINNKLQIAKSCSIENCGISSQYQYEQEKAMNSSINHRSFCITQLIHRIKQANLWSAFNFDTTLGWSLLHYLNLCNQAPSKDKKLHR